MKSYIKYLLASLVLMASGMGMLRANVRQDVTTPSSSDIFVHTVQAGLHNINGDFGYPVLMVLPDSGKHIELDAEIFETEEEVDHSKLQAASKVLFHAAFYALIFGYLTFFFVENVPALRRYFAPMEGHRFLLLGVFRL